MGGRKGGRDRARPRSALKSSSLLVAPDDAEDIEDLSLASRARRANRVSGLCEEQRGELEPKNLYMPEHFRDKYHI